MRIFQGKLHQFDYGFWFVSLAAQDVEIKQQQNDVAKIREDISSQVPRLSMSAEINYVKFTEIHLKDKSISCYKIM